MANDETPRSLKPPKFLAGIRSTITWVGSTREDSESFMEGANAALNLVTEHYYSTTMLNPSLVGQKRAEQTDFYYSQKILGLEDRIKRAREKRDEYRRELDKLKQVVALLKDDGSEAVNVTETILRLRTKIAVQAGELRRLNASTPVVEGKKEKQTKALQLAHCQHELGKALARIKELEARLA